MVAGFSYRPKYVDIRVNRPGAGEAERAPSERACDHIGCRRAGAHKAPKSRAGGDEVWWFCLQHAGEYNRRWDYFKDMTEAEQAAYRAGEEIGHRPTWSFRPGRGDRISATRFWQAAKPGDAFNVFTSAGEAARPPRAAKPRIGRVQAMALEVLALEETADPVAVRTRYAELVKRFHPDSNGGDRTAEAQLNKVVRAYKTLKAARMA